MEIVIPCAGRSERYPNTLPKYLLKMVIHQGSKNISGVTPTFLRCVYTAGNFKFSTSLNVLKTSSD